ncbi:MAG: hypothetical protein DME67_04530 [Verrucomicrobia bacterium]|nr:MAG: hypothetical protein DME67_04530 [Verrucomicrobiota bacterium]
MHDRAVVADRRACADERVEMVQWCRLRSFLAFGITVNISSRGLHLRQLQDAPANFIFHLFATLGWVAILFQLCNVALLGAFWPFFTGIVVQLVAAMFQFARMILLPPE